MGKCELLSHCATKPIVSEKFAVSPVPTIFTFLLGYQQAGQVLTYIKVQLQVGMDKQQNQQVTL